MSYAVPSWSRSGSRVRALGSYAVRPGGVLLRRADEAQRRVVLEAVEVGVMERFQRGAGGQLRSLEIDGVIVAAEGEFPALVHSRAAAGAQEVLPGNAALDGPAL